MLLIQSALWKDDTVDLLVQDGKIVELVHCSDRSDRSDEAAAAYGDAQIVDAAGLLLLPALSDCHTHLREPGFEYKEDIASGLKAAAHGGFANIMCMANTAPVNDKAAVTRYMQEKAVACWPFGPRLFPVAALSRGLEGKQLAPLAELSAAGCVAVSNDGLPVASTEFFRRGMEYAADFGLRVIDHCEDPFMAMGTGVNEGVLSSRLGLKGTPSVSESLHVARDILLAQYLDLPVHLAHLSCRESVELVARAKEHGIPVTAETCPHYLILTEDACDGYDTSAKVNPPLRTNDDVQALRQALRTGVIDMLVTDHAPHAAQEKEVPFTQAPNGISGLDTALCTTMALVQQNILSIEDTVRLWCQAAETIFGLPCCNFAKGDTADFLLYDPAAGWEAGPQTLYSKGKNTPLSGQFMTGRTRSLFIEGKQII